MANHQAGAVVFPREEAGASESGPMCARTHGTATPMRDAARRTSHVARAQAADADDPEDADADKPYASARRTAPAKRPLSRVTRGSTKTAAQAGRRAAHGAARWLIIRPERSFFHARKRERAGVVRCALARWRYDAVARRT